MFIIIFASLLNDFSPRSLLKSTPYHPVKINRLYTDCYLMRLQISKCVVLNNMHSKKTYKVQC